MHCTYNRFCIMHEVHDASARMPTRTWHVHYVESTPRHKLYFPLVTNHAFDMLNQSAPCFSKLLDRHSRAATNLSIRCCATGYRASWLVGANGDLRNPWAYRVPSYHTSILAAHQQLNHQTRPFDK